MNKQIMLILFFSVLIVIVPRLVFPKLNELELNGSLSNIGNRTLLTVNITNAGPPSENTTLVVYLGAFLCPVDYQLHDLGHLAEGENRSFTTELYSPSKKIKFPLTLIVSAYSETHIAEPFIPRLFTVIVK